MSSGRRLALLLVPAAWLAACGESVTPLGAPGTEPAPGLYGTAAPPPTPPPPPSSYPPQPRGVPYPTADWPVGELPASVDRAAIDAAVDTAFGAADALGGCPQELDYLHERLLDPLGITTDDLLLDPGGCWYGGRGADMTTRDFARFGLLFLRGGRWEDEQILPASWVDESRAPAATNPGYGLQWWLDADNNEWFRAAGLFGQFVVVEPDLDLVIAANTTAGGDPAPMIDTVLAAFAGEPLAAAPPTSPPVTLPASR
jgi:Beta-lactamase